MTTFAPPWMPRSAWTNRKGIDMSAVKNDQELRRLIVLARKSGAEVSVTLEGGLIHAVSIRSEMFKTYGTQEMPSWMALEELRKAKAAGLLGPVIRSVSIGPLPRPMPQGVVDPMPVIVARLTDGTAKKLFSFYPDEIQFTEAEFVGRSIDEAMEIKRMKDVAYLTGNPAATATHYSRLNAEIAQELQNQDNLATAEPLFLVKQLERVWGVDAGYTDKFAWLDEDNTETGAELDALLDANELKKAAELGYKRVGYIEVEAYVTACFTRSAAERYIEENQHNLNHPFVFVDSLNKNHEMIFVRQQLLAGPSIDEQGGGQAEPARQELVEMIRTMAHVMAQQQAAMEPDMDDEGLGEWITKGLALVEGEPGLNRMAQASDRPRG